MIEFTGGAGVGVHGGPATSPSRARLIEANDKSTVRWSYCLLLLVLLPLFGEVFHYMKIVRPLWLLSKIFPLLSLPLCLFLLRGGGMPRGTRQILVSMLYLVLLPSFTGIFTYQQSFVLGLTSQVKLLPILYFFSFTGLLRVVRPTSQEISRSFLLLAAASFGLLLLWLFVPHSEYTAIYRIGDSPLFSLDSRGYRIRMPFFFGLIGIFYCFRRFFTDGKMLWLAGSAAGFAAVISIIRARSSVLGLAVVLFVGAIRFARRGVRIAILAAIPFAIFGLLSIPYVASAFDTSAASGFDTRRLSIERAVDFLGQNPLRWLLGVGSITPFDPGGMIRFFNHYLFVADITWVGVVFEFGILGALLVLLVPARGVWESRHIRLSRESAFLGSLQDYLLFSIVISGLYPLTLQPGEFVVILAIFVHEKSELCSFDRGFSVA